MENKSAVLRIAVSVLWYAICSAANTMFKALYQLQVGETAVTQLEDSNAAFVQMKMLMSANRIGAIVFLVFMLGLIFVWKSYIKKLHDNAAKFCVGVTLLLFAMGYSTSAHAYYDKTDRAEWVNIEANQSAFLIPAVGANKTSQKQFGSIEYLSDNKVASKRVLIPHVKADNTALIGDFYVPAATLYLVDRTPYTREWVNDTDRGTSTKKEGFHFESADSINIRTGITISASVSEEDAAKFFYWFGTASIQNSQKPEDVFASTKYGKSLADVMDTVVRAKVQQVMAKEFAKRSFLKGIQEKAAIIDVVEATVKDEFAKKGITIAFVGYAEELSFDPRIQKALDDSVIAAVQYANKDAMLAVVEINRKNAEIDIVRAQAKAIGNWNGAINFPFILPDSWAQAIAGFIKK